MQLKEVQLPSFFKILRSELNKQKTDRWLDGWDIATFVEFKKCLAIIGRFILGGCISPRKIFRKWCVFHNGI